MEHHLQSLKNLKANEIKFVFTDIDGTLTAGGRLPAESYNALWNLDERGITVIPVTGRPAGWCDLIARFWPVHGVVGENGAIAYHHDGKRMQRMEYVSRKIQNARRAQLKGIAREVKSSVPRARISADQFSRRFDLAIDFAEDVHPPLSTKEIDAIVSIFEKHGAHAKVSNIHVNGWFGDFDKLSGCERYCENWLGFDLSKNLNHCLFVGDSPNDEPMFKYFRQSCGVANIRDFKDQITHLPTYVTRSREAGGFVEIANHLTSAR